MQKEALTDRVWLWGVGLNPNPGEIWPGFSGQFQWKWGTQQLRRTRKIFTLQQTKDVQTVQYVSVGWGEHSFLSYLQKCTCSASKHTLPNLTEGLWAHCLTRDSHWQILLLFSRWESSVRYDWIISFSKPICNNCSWKSPGCLAVIKKWRHKQDIAEAVRTSGQIMERPQSCQLAPKHPSFSR